MEPFCVSGDAAEVSEARFIVGVEGGSGPTPLAMAGFAKPKPRSFAPEVVSMMFPGFRSRALLQFRTYWGDAMQNPDRYSTIKPGIAAGIHLTHAACS
jgi:hypothetical protein